MEMSSKDMSYREIKDSIVAYVGWHCDSSTRPVLAHPLCYKASALWRSRGTQMWVHLEGNCGWEEPLCPEVAQMQALWGKGSYQDLVHLDAGLARDSALTLARCAAPAPALPAPLLRRRFERRLRRSPHMGVCTRQRSSRLQHRPYPSGLRRRKALMTLQREADSYACGRISRRTQVKELQATEDGEAGLTMTGGVTPDLPEQDEGESKTTLSIGHGLNVVGRSDDQQKPRQSSSISGGKPSRAKRASVQGGHHDEHVLIHTGGEERLTFTLDFVGSENVISEVLAHQCWTKPSAGSQVRLGHTAANSTTVPAMGDQSATLRKTEGHTCMLNMQGEGVHKPLSSVSRICDVGDRVVFTIQGGRNQR